MHPLRPFATLLALTLATAAHATCPPPATGAAMMQQAADMVNGYRVSADLEPVQINPTLAAAAQTHACDMAAGAGITRVGTNRADLVRRLKAARYKFSAANENVGQFSTSNAAEWWYNSPGHRANILSSSSTEMGFGVALGADRKLYWAMISAKP
jgi:uncharacterized protein YkwD